MLMSSKTTQIEMYDTKMSSSEESFKKVNKHELFVKNPNYDQLLCISDIETCLKSNCSEPWKVKNGITNVSIVNHGYNFPASILYIT